VRVAVPDGDPDAVAPLVSVCAPAVAVDVPWFARARLVARVVPVPFVPAVVDVPVVPWVAVPVAPCVDPRRSVVPVVVPPWVEVPLVVVVAPLCVVLPLCALEVLWAPTIAVHPMSTARTAGNPARFIS